MSRRKGPLRRNPRPARRPDAGSLSLEVVLVVPVLMLLALFVLWAGRGGRAGLIADLAAEEAATAAALACEQGQDLACEDLVGTVLSARPGLDFLCIGGARADPSPGFEGLVEGRFIRFADVADPLDPDAVREATAVGLFGVRFVCETDGAVAPLAGVFPTVTFRGQAAEVAIDQGPPRAEILPPASAVDEGNPLVFTVRLDAPSPVGFALTYTTAGITGYTNPGSNCTVAPVPDYEEPSPLTVTLDQGDIEQTITIPTCDDSLYEADERIRLTLDPPPPLDLLDPNSPPVVVIDTGAGDHTATGTITDNDQVPAVTVTHPSEREGSGNLTFQVQVPGPIGRDVTVSYNTVGVFVNPVPPGIATPGAGGTCASLILIGADFREVANRSHTFTPTDPLPLTHDVDVEVCDDLVGEPAETLELAWDAGPEGAGTAPGIIEDDEPRLAIVDACTPPDPAHDVCEREDAGSATFVVERRMHPDVTTSPPEVKVHYVTRPVDQNAGVFHFAAAGGAPDTVSDPCSSPPDEPLTVTPPNRNHDYVPQSGELTIPAGTAQTTAPPVAVMINDDGLYEHEESFRLLLCRPSDNAFVDEPWGRAIIFDNDYPPTVMVGDADADEPATAADSTELVFTVGLFDPTNPNTPLASGRDVHLDYHADRDDCYVPAGSAPADVQALTASPGVDFDAGPCRPPTRVTIWAESDPPTLDIAVPVLYDDLYEPDGDPATPDPHTETLALRVAATNAVFADTTGSCAPHDPADLADPDNNLDNDCALGVIVDLDTPPELSVSGQCTPADSTLAVPSGVVACAVEGDDVAFELHLDRMSSQPVEVGWNVVPVAAATPVPAVVPPVGRARLADLVAPPPPPQQPPSGTVTIAAGSQLETIRVPSFDDRFDEHGLELFELHVSVSDGAVVAAGHDVSLGAIEDDDDPPELRVLDTCDGPADVNTFGQAAVNNGDACAHEDGGQMIFTVGLFDPDSPNTPLASGRRVTVLWETRLSGLAPADQQAAGGPPGQSGADYVTVDTNTVPADRRITIPAGQLREDFTVQINDDDIDETDELFLVEVTADPAVQFGDPVGQGVIVDNDTTELSVAVGCTETVLGALGDPLDVRGCADEDDPDAKIEFTVQLSNPSSQTVTVEYYTQDLTTQGLRAATAGPGQDYTGHASTPALSRQKLTITPPDTTETIVVPIRDDDVYEHDEVFQLRLADPSDGTPMNASLPLAASRALGAILNDDDPPRLSITDAAGEEPDAVEFTATLLRPAGNLRADIGRMVTVEWSTADGTATTGAGGDYSAVTGSVLTFDPTAPLVNARTQQTARVTILDDDLAEDDETFELRVTGVTPPGIALDTGARPCAAESSIGGDALDDCAVGTITDDNDEMPQVHVEAVEADEGDPLEFTVRLVDRTDTTQDLASGREVTVTYQTRPGVGDGAASARPQGQLCDVQVPVFGTAYDYDYDYIAASGTLTFDPDDINVGERTAQTVQVTTCDDWHDELDAETLTLEITAATGADLPAGTAAAGTIHDDEDLPVAVIVDATPDDPDNHATAQEGDPVEFTVRLVNADVAGRPAPSAHEVTVPYHTYSTGTGNLDATGGGAGPPRDPPDADYERVGVNTLAAAFAARAFEAPIDIATFTDTAADSGERFQVVLDAPTNAQRDNNARIGIGAITDGCIDPEGIQPDEIPIIEVEDFAVAEAVGVAWFTVTINRAWCVGTDVHYDFGADSDSDTATAGADLYRIAAADTMQLHGLSGQDLGDIPAGSTSVTLPVAIIDDGIDEFDETFTLRVFWDSAAGVATDSSHWAFPVVTIEDDDPEPVVQVFGPVDSDGDPVAIAEGGDVNFTVRLAHRDAQGRGDDSVVSGKPVSFSYYTCCDTSTATPNDDYPRVSVISNYLTFPAAQSPSVPPTEHAFGIATHVDDVTEGEESFQVRLHIHPQIWPDEEYNAVLDNHRIAQGTITDGCINPANHVDGGSVPEIQHSSPGETEAENTHRNLAGTAYENPPPWGFPYRLYVEGLCPGVDFEISYSTRDRTAAAGDDYVAASGTLSGTTDSDGLPVDAQGDPIAVFVEVIDDHIDEEYHEEFDLDLGWGPSMPDDYEAATWTYFGRIYDDDDLEVSVADASGTEGSPVSFEVSATPSSRQVEVSYATMQLLEGDNIAVQAAGASCTGEADYVGAASSVVFGPVTDPGAYDAGDRVTMPVSVVTCPDDDDDEEDERFQLNIAVDSPTPRNNRDRVRVTDDAATGTIRDCLDTTLALSGTTPPTLSTQDVTVREDPTGPTIEVPFTWSQRPCGDKAIRFEVVNVTATHGDDFTGPGGGSTYGLIDNYLEYTIVDDHEFEGEETFRVRMHFCRIGTSGACGPNSLDAFSYHPDYAALPVAEATVTIADNDCVDARSDTETPPRVTITPRNEQWIEHDGPVQAIFDLGSPLCEYATVGFTAVEGTAVHGQDFLISSGGQGITRGHTSFPLDFSLIDDNTIEGIETFYVDVQWSALVPDSWTGETVRSTHNILDDDCISVASPLDDRVPAMSYEYEETEVAEGDSFYAVASFDPPLCERSRVTDTFHFITVEPEDFAISRPDGHTWSRYVSDGTSTARGVLDTADDGVWEGREQFRTVFNWHTDMCGRAAKFCGRPGIENVLTISDIACVSETEANDPDFQLELTIDAPSEVSEADGSYSVTLSLDSVFCDDVILNHHADITGSDTASRDDVDALSDLSLSLTAPSQEQPEQPQEQVIVIDHDTSGTPGSIVDDALDENDETFTFRAFLTLARTWVSEATVTIVDDDPVPLLAVDDVVLAEPVDDAEATMVFTVGLENLAGESIPSGREVRVDYATNPLGTTGEATQAAGCGDGADYVASSGELVFTPGVETLPVEVTICRDSDDAEPYERLQLVLERDPGIPSPVNADIRDHIGVGTIPGLATVSIRDSYQWAEGATHQGRLVRRFEVSVSGGLTEAATVQWATEDCTDADPHCAHPATAGDDYTAHSGTLSFDSDTTTRWIEVAVVNDELDEYDEVFFVRLTNPSSSIVLSGFTHPDPVGIGHIIDDDPLPVLSFELAALTVDEGTSVNVHAVLDGPSGRPIVWRPSVAAPDDGPHATRNLDYTIDLSARTIEPGDTSDHVTVTALADTVDDDGERLEVVIGISTNVQWSATAQPTALVTIVEPECASPDDSAPPLFVESVEIEQGESGQIMVTSFPALCTDEPIPVNLDWRTTLVTAEAEDFSLSNGVVWGNQAVTFRGEFPFTVQTVVDDDSDDDIFRLEVRWRAPDSWAGASETYGTVTILDCVDPATDDPPVMSLPDAEVLEGTQARIPLTVSPALCETLPAGALEYRHVQFTSEVGDHLSFNEWPSTGEAFVAGQPLWFQVSTFYDDDVGDEIFFVDVRWSATGPASRWAGEQPVRSRITIVDYG